MRLPKHPEDVKIVFVPQNNSANQNCLFCLVNSDMCFGMTDASFFYGTWSQLLWRFYFNPFISWFLFVVSPFDLILHSPYIILHVLYSTSLVYLPLFLDLCQDSKQGAVVCGFSELACHLPSEGDPGCSTDPIAMQSCQEQLAFNRIKSS